MKTSLVCKLCNNSIVEEYKDATLGTVVLKLLAHAKNHHSKESKEYYKALDLLMQVMPSYFFILNFVDIEATNKLDTHSGELIKEIHNIVLNALELNLEVEEVIEE